jgi:predicted DNA-binding protein (MmcQ/YjbR family)
VDNERIRAICLAMPHVVETVGWGHHLVYWVGDKAIGGKMFALTDIAGSGAGVLTFHCGVENFHELLEKDGIRPAPYAAKNFWVMLERWNALRPQEIEEQLKSAHALIYQKLPNRTKAILAMPAKERAKLIKERKKLLAAKKKETAG